MSTVGFVSQLWISCCQNVLSYCFHSVLPDEMRGFGGWRFFFVPQNHCRGFCWLNQSVKCTHCRSLHSSWCKPSFVYSPVILVYFKSHELAWTLHQKLRQHCSSPGLQNLYHLLIISVCDFKVTLTLIIVLLKYVSRYRFNIWQHMEPTLINMDVT